MTEAPTVGDALALQAHGCEMLGSPLYATLLRGLARDHAGGGLTAELLEGRSDQPVHDAVPLRLLGAVHRIVLEGRAPELAAHYPSAGGAAGGDPTPTFLATVAEHRPEVEEGLSRTVQTNEVGRAAVVAPAFALLARRHGLPLRTLEVGSAAGLILRWDRYRYEAGRGSLGDRASPVRFTDVWEGMPPDLSGHPVVAMRRGCDVAPIDASTEDGRLTLLSFVWPDQLHRFSRLRAALSVAATDPVRLDRADAGAWVADRLAEPADGTTTVVFHTIVWQYVPRAGKDRMRRALAEAGAAAGPGSPVAWLRMEPAGPMADLRLTTWPHGDEEILATAGYHGEPVRWGSDSADPA